MRFQKTASSVQRLRVERQLTMVHDYHDRENHNSVDKKIRNQTMGCEDDS